MKRQYIFFTGAFQRYTLFGVLFGLLFPIGSTIVRILESGLAISLSNAILIQSTDRLLWVIDTAPVFLGIFAGLAGYRQDTLQKLNTELVNSEKKLRNFQATLEERVEQRTNELAAASQSAEKRSGQLRAFAEIARAVTTIRDLDELLSQLARLISERLGFYHIGIFLLDSKKEFAILSAAFSEGGQRMLARGHRLRVGEQGIVGYVTHSGNPRVALDVGADAVYFNNPDLPQTHSEVALPLKFGNETIGALDIQSTVTNAFSQDDIGMFTILADQVSVAIQNARALQQAQRALHEAEIATSQLTGRAWRSFTETVRVRGYRYNGIKSAPLRNSSSLADDKNIFSIPVQLRGQTIGSLKFKYSENKRWTEDELSIIEESASSLAIAIDNARLLNEAQKRATRETFLSELAAKYGNSFQLDSILRDTVEELGNTLKNSTVTFQLVNPSLSTSTNNRKNGSSANSEDKSE